MNIFGYELIFRKIPKPPKPLTPLEKLFKAVDEINIAWRVLEQEKGNTIRPWIVWENKEVVVTNRKGSIEIIYTSE